MKRFFTPQKSNETNKKNDQYGTISVDCSFYKPNNFCLLLLLNGNLFYFLGFL